MFLVHLPLMGKCLHVMYENEDTKMHRTDTVLLTRALTYFFKGTKKSKGKNIKKKKLL